MNSMPAHPVRAARRCRRPPSARCGPPSARPIGCTVQSLSSAAAAARRRRGPAPRRRRCAAARDQLLVLALERRVGDLEDVEDAHLDVVGEVRERARHAEEADLALVAEPDISSIVPLGLHLRATRRHVDLDEVEVVGPQAPQALLDAGADVRRAVVVRDGGVASARRRRAGSRTWRRGSTRRGVRDVAADQLLAAAVVDRGVDQVDAGVEHRVEQPPGRPRPRSPARGARPRSSIAP